MSAHNYAVCDMCGRIQHKPMAAQWSTFSRNTCEPFGSSGNGYASFGWRTDYLLCWECSKRLVSSFPALTVTANDTRPQK